MTKWCFFWQILCIYLATKFELKKYYIITSKDISIFNLFAYTLEFKRQTLTVGWKTLVELNQILYAMSFNEIIYAFNSHFFQIENQSY
jgi:hypothetical protein